MDNKKNWFVVVAMVVFCGVFPGCIGNAPEGCITPDYHPLSEWCGDTWGMPGVVVSVNTETACGDFLLCNGFLNYVWDDIGTADTHPECEIPTYDFSGDGVITGEEMSGWCISMGYVGASIDTSGCVRCFGTAP